MIDYDNILSGDDTEGLFTDQPQIETNEDDLFVPFSKDTDESEEETPEDKPEKDPDNLESVGGDNEDQSGESAQITTQNPSPRFYASIAKALVDEGVFSGFDISEDEIEKINTADDFLELSKKWSESIREADDRRILQATQAGVEPNKIRQYEQTLRQLDQQFTEANLKLETPEAEALRQQIIYQDYINRGFSQDRAKKAMERSFNAGTDVEDALESIESVKEYFSTAYNQEISESKKIQEAQTARIKQEADQLKKELLESTEPITGFKLEKQVRQKAFDALVKPIARDESGNSLTAIQKFEKENPVQFRKALGVLFTVTDGFKDLGKIVKQQAKKEARKGLSELERSLINSSRIDGSLQLAGLGGENEYNQSDRLVLAD